MMKREGKDGDCKQERGREGRGGTECMRVRGALPGEGGWNESASEPVRRGRRPAGGRPAGGRWRGRTGGRRGRQAEAGRKERMRISESNGEETNIHPTHHPPNLN
jgi:hypothetical protein